MSNKIKNKLELFINSVAAILNSLNSSINNKVDSTIYNNQTTTFQDLITGLNDEITILNQLKGLHFTADQANNKILLKNELDVTLTELDVTFLNNEGTTFTVNQATNSLELRNDKGELLSTVPIGNLVSNIVSTIGFNPTIPYKLEIRRTDGSVASSTDIEVSNVKNLDSRLNSIKTLYNYDDSLTGNRNVNLGTYFLKLGTNMGSFEFKNDGLIIPSKLLTNKFNLSQNGQILDFALNNNLPKILLGNPDIQELILHSKSYVLRDLPVKTTQNRTLCVDSNGNLAYSDGIGTILSAGDGIFIDGNVISVIPQDKINLTFNW